MQVRAGPGTDERGRRGWVLEAVRSFPRPGAGRSRAAVTPENEALLAALTVADELDALRDRQRAIAREARAGGVEVRAIARAPRVSPQSACGWLDG